MGLVGDVVDREERPAYVRFETRQIEDKAASMREGHYRAKDVDFAGLTPPYSRDLFWIEVPQWFANMKQDVAQGRLPEKWANDYRQAYDHWKKTAEVPVNGTPIKHWGVVSPAQRETLLRANILTVEDLAGINDEGIKRVGMGAVDLKNKAVAWMAQLKDKGPLTIAMAKLQSENSALESSLETLKRQVEALQAATAQLAPPPIAFVPQAEAITADDMMDEPPPPKRGKR